MSNMLSRYVEKSTGMKLTPAAQMNYIRESMDDDFKAAIPELNPLLDLNHQNIPYAQYEARSNQYFNVLINKIGKTIVKWLEWYEHPLGVFRTDNFEYGETLEEIYTGLADELQYDPKQTASPFRFFDTPIKVFYHDINREAKYARSIEKAWTQKAFHSNSSFDSFIDGLFGSLVSSDTVDEYERIKQLVSLSLTPVTVPGGGTINAPATAIDTTATDWLMDFNKELIRRTNYFQIPSRTRTENAAGVPMATPLEDQYLLVDVEMSAEIDIMLANAFNMDKAAVLAKKIVVDQFPAYTGTGPLTGATPRAALISRRSFILQDKLFSMENIYNPENMVYNYFMHHHEIISYSMLENMHVYYEAA